MSSDLDVIRAAMANLSLEERLALLRELAPGHPEAPADTEPTAPDPATMTPAPGSFRKTTSLQQWTFLQNLGTRDERIQWEDYTKKDVLNSVLECNYGILWFILYKSSDRLREKLIFERETVDEKEMRIVFNGVPHSYRMNAITLCGECTLGTVDKRRDGGVDVRSDANISRRSDFIGFLVKLLVDWVAKMDRLRELRDLIRTEALWWTGAEEEYLWRMESCRENLKLIFDFFIKYKDKLQDVIKELIEGEESRVCTHLGVYDIEKFEIFMDEFLQDDSFVRMLSPKHRRKGWNIIKAWSEVLSFHGIQKVQRFWAFLKKKLDELEELDSKEFLQHKDSRNWNTLLSAFRNEDQGVVSYVWDQYKEHFPEQERKRVLIQSFSGVQSGYDINMNVFHNFIYDKLVRQRELIPEDVENILGVKDENDNTLETWITMLDIERDVVPRKRREVRPYGEKTIERMPLILASGEGSAKVVELLLRCGADVNASDGDGHSPIEQSLNGEHNDVTAILLEWDSAFPPEHRTVLRNLLDSVIEGNEGCRKIFKEREELHSLVAKGGFRKVEDIIRKHSPWGKSMKRCVNRKGESLLFTAACNEQQDMWALLKYQLFVYADKREEEKAEAYVAGWDFNRAMVRYFKPLPCCHVETLMARSNVFVREGESTAGYKDRVENFLRRLERLEHAKLILQCLQYDHDLEIVFDFRSDNVQGMHAVIHCGHVFGLMDNAVGMMFAAAMETEKFTESDVLSNVIHEMTHRVMALVFNNWGLPYRSDDDASKKAYEQIVKDIEESMKSYHGAHRVIVQRALKEGVVYHEMIVKVTEIIVKYKTEKEGDSTIRSAFDSAELESLYEFYVNNVEKEIKKFMEKNATDYKVRRWELGKGVLGTSFYSDEIGVIASLGSIKVAMHRNLKVIGVSNLSLGVFHLKTLSQGYEFVDWSRFENKAVKEYFMKCLNKRQIDQLAIVWDKKKAPTICSGKSKCKSNCVLLNLSDILEKVVLVTSMHGNLKKKAFLKDQWNNYTWEHLTESTKECIKEREMNFKGKNMKLSEALKSLPGQQTEEDKAREFIGADEISILIDQDVHLQKAWP